MPGVAEGAVDSVDSPQGGSHDKTSERVRLKTGTATRSSLAALRGASIDRGGRTSHRDVVCTAER